MSNDTRPAHLYELRTNRMMCLEPDDESFCPIVELILIGYRARYDLASEDGKHGTIKKGMEAHTVRILVTDKTAKYLRECLEKVEKHLESLKSINEIIGAVLKPDSAKESSDEQPKNE